MQALIRPLAIRLGARQRWCLAVMLPAVVAAFAGQHPVRAHAIESSLERVAGLNRTLELQSRFSSGEPAAGAAVSLVAPGAEPIALGHTDPSGQLRFSLPARLDPGWEVRVDQGPGHRDYLELPEGVVPPSSPAPSRAQISHLLRLIPQPLTYGLLGGGTTALLVGLLWTSPRRRRS